MKYLLIIAFFSFSTTICGQQSTEWLKKLENPEYEIDKLKKENFITKYRKYDFSTLLVPKTNFIGYIGKDFQRIKTHFSSITKDTSNPNKYLITGISTVSNTVCDFTGEIIIQQVREYKSMHYGVDNKHKNSGFKSQGILIGTYILKENKTQKHSGVFKGIVTLNWYVDKFGIIQYDRIELFSDRYRNNQYIGTWTDYKTGNKKICNWGEYRIPFSGDLDIGAAEFSPNPKYKNKGWNQIVK